MFSIYADGQLLCSSEVLNEDMYAIDSNTSVTCEIENRAGSFNFVMHPTHYLYNSLEKYKTEIDVWLDDYCIFTGRVVNMTISMQDKSVYCEGCLSYFNDSIQFKFERKSITPRERFKEIIDNHNSQVDSFKQFTVGIIDIPEADNVEEFENINPHDSFSILNTDLLDRFGGYLKVYREDSFLRIDWIKNYNHICSQPIDFGENMVQYSESDNDDSPWSILFPTASGSDDVDYYIGSVNNGSNFYEVSERIQKYGKIIKNVEFEKIDSDQKLYDEMLKWLDKNDKIPDPSVTISAVDLSVLFDDEQRFAIGDTISFKLWSDSEYRSLICNKITYSLFKPGQVELTLGAPVRTLSEVYFSDQQETNNKINDVDNRVDDVDAEVKQVTDRIGDAERDLEVVARDLEITAQNVQINADAIAAVVKELELKASGSELVDLQKVVTSYVEKNDETIKGMREETTRLATRLGAVELDINGGEGAVGLKAQYAQIWGDQQALEGDMEAIRNQVDETGEYLNDAWVQINAMLGQIELMATRKELDEIGTRLNEVGIDIDAIKDELLLKASYEVLEEFRNDVGIRLDGINGELELKASRDDVNDLDARITVNYNNIQLTVRRDDIISAINLSAESARIMASKIVLDGLVTASELEAEIANIKSLFANLNVSGNAVVTGSLNVEGGTTLKGTTVINNLTVGTQRATWHSATFVTKVGVTFNQSRHTFLTSAELNSAKTAVVTGGWTGNVVTSIAVNPETQTIQYLGLAD